MPVVSTIISRLNNQLAPFIALPHHQGEPWHLNTHQGRKTFARFVGKRDRTGLHALQAHFGHVTRAMTDRGYVGTDFALDDLIDRHAQEETRAALEEVLTATALGGKRGRMIAARSQFRGRTRDDAQAYVRFLMEETDLRLGVCDWGYCVYRVETAACFGDEKGPNPVLRTESTCLTCANFAVTAKHRPVWQARRDRNADLLAHPGLDPVSRELAETRIAECDRILGDLDHGKDARDGKMAALTPHEKRLRNTDRKLREALERLVKGLPTHPDLQKRSYRLTVATLAREARVGRNAIYTNHRSMIDELRRASDRRIVPEKLAAWEDKLAQQRALIQVLQIEERRMVTENAVLLKRILEAETEVERQKRHNARLITERDRAMKPVALPRGPKS